MASKSENQRKANSGSSGTSSNANAQSSLDQASHGEKGESGDHTKPSRLKKVWTYLELDMFTILLMAKGGIPPTLALGLLQITAVANHFTTIGYLDRIKEYAVWIWVCLCPDGAFFGPVPMKYAVVWTILFAIISVIGLCILPRAKFLQNLITNLVLLSTAAALALLAGYCSTQARAHTTVITPQNAREYNSSSSVVCAIWLFFQVYLSNAFRAKYPQLQVPVILFSIFAVVSCINLPRFPTMPTVINFVRNLLEAFLAGLACATVVSLLVLPVTVRRVVFKEMAGYIGLIRKCLNDYQTYLRSLEDPERLEKVMVAGHGKGYKPSGEIAALNGSVTALTSLHGKLQGDLVFAKREIAIGKLDASDLGSISKHLRRIMLPTVGLSTLGELLERAASIYGWTEEHLESGLNEDERYVRETLITEWTDNIRSLRCSLEPLTSAMCDGLEHASLQLQFAKRSKSHDDVESKADTARPGESGFADTLERVINNHHAGKREMLRDWTQRHGINLPADFFDRVQSRPETFMNEFPGASEEVHYRNQRQLYMLLYMDFLIWSCAKAVLSLVRYTDELVASGALSRSRLIVPGWRRLRKWATTFLNTQEGATEDSRGDLGDIDQAAAVVDLGSAFNKKKDAEHLPAQNFGERCGDVVRLIPKALRSDASAFGFRVAAATMSIAIVGYLHDTNTWFVKHRALWAIIMTAISMTPTAGQSVFSFGLRILGTIIAMVASFICYYVPDKHRVGVIVLVWLFTSLAMWVPLKRPQLAIVGIISIVTNILILGYTLEVEKLGQAVVTSNGQEYLPLYQIGPYRLAAVCAGLLVAFIFTILPYPITDHSVLRQNVGGSLYLLANYYSVVHESIQVRTKDMEGDPADKMSIGNRLTKIRAKIFVKQSLMLTNLRTYAGFQKFEIPLGGRFPKEQYDRLIESISSTTRYAALLSYSSEALIEHDDGGNDLSQWSKDLKALLSTVGHTSHEITSMLSLLSASVTNGQPLPPYLAAPEPYNLSKKLEALDPDILSIRHIDEKEFAVFGVFQVASRCIIHELEVLLQIVKELVGELDFSFRVVQTANSSRTMVADKSDDMSKSKGD